LNAQIEGSGPSAYRLVAWWSGAGYEDTVTLYGRLSDPRWHGSSSSTTPQTAVFTFSDETGVFADASVEVSVSSGTLVHQRRFDVHFGS
jgi:hypothetical protein